MDFDALHYPYASRRTAVYARRGMVTTSQPLAAQAGLRILQRGGNAIDAALATAAALTVLEPTSNGIGGDAFALVWSGNQLHGLNASGPAPRRISLDALRKSGLSEMPRRGFPPVTVPGAPAAWAELAERFGRLPLLEVLEPAIEYATHGFPISPTLGKLWGQAYASHTRELRGDAFGAWFTTFAPQGAPPAPGEIWRSPEHAQTLQSIGETGAESFYRGELAERIEAFSVQHGGYLRADDLASFQPEWVQPLHVAYRGYEVWELPPNGHGVVTLMALNLLKGFELDIRDTATSYHHQIEALKLAYADGKQYITDPKFMQVRVEDLLSDAYADERRRLIGARAHDPVPGSLPDGGTVYLCAADAEGNMISYIQSNYQGFGSGLVVPGTGIALHNRGHSFSLDPGHANRLEPGKRPYHTIIPGFLTRGGRPVGPFGVMGGFMQPQGHLQVVTNMVDFHLNPQAALDAPRWQWHAGRRVTFEPETPVALVRQLARMGHDAVIDLNANSFGHGQIIWQLDGGVLVGGTEPRTDGQIAAW